MAHYIDTILFFDTETSGFARGKDVPLSDPSQPWVCQLACIQADLEGNTINSFASIVTSNGRPMNYQAAEIHGISKARADGLGIPKELALGVFYEFAKKANRIVAHNIAFDNKIIRIMANSISPACACDIEDVMDSTELYCTMQHTKDICCLPYPKRAGIKPPKLTELYTFLFDRNMDDDYTAHDAMGDTKCMKDCYFELVRRGLI